MEDELLDKKEHLMLEIANLELDSKIGKDRHFIAADRKNTYRIILGLISVIGTAIIASQALRDLFTEIESIKYFQNLVISIISLIVGVCTAVLGFLGLEKEVAQHRFVGNMYIEIARKSNNLLHELATISNKDDYQKIKRKFKKLLKRYLEVNKEGESCPTSKKDSDNSFKQNEKERFKLKQTLKARKTKLLNINNLES